VFVMFTQLRIILAVIAVAGVLAGAAFGGWKLRDMRAAQEDAARTLAAAELQGKRAGQAGAAAGGHERDKERIRTEFVTITETVEHIIEKPIYRHVCLDADGLRALSQAIGARGAAAAEPGHPVP
jgi:type II secretory pathway pseudopilin PulG